jgi:protein-tyrosine phosphatase
VLDYLRQRIGQSPRLSLGCDFHLSYENLQDVMLFPDRYAIEGSHYLLVELSNYSVPVQMEEYFSKLLEKGLTPVVTHPERNPIMQRTPQRILQWVELGCVIQVTGSALTGRWGQAAWQTAQWLLKREAVHVLATDAHDTKSRPPVLSTARNAAAEICGEEVALALVDGNPRAIVSGQPLPYFPSPVMKN